MALLSRGINWRKLFDAGDQVRIASALAQLSADLEDLDARMEGGTNDLNQAQQFPAQDLLERGTQFLTPDLVTSTDGSVTVTPDSFRGTVDLAVPSAFNSRPLYISYSASKNFTTASTTISTSDATVTANIDASSMLSSKTITFPVAGTVLAVLTMAVELDSVSSAAFSYLIDFMDATVTLSGSAGSFRAFIRHNRQQNFGATASTTDWSDNFDWSSTGVAMLNVTAGDTLVFTMSGNITVPQTPVGTSQFDVAGDIVCCYLST